MVNLKEKIKKLEDEFSDFNQKHYLTKSQDNYFCPNCGKKKIYDINPGGFGPNVVCLNCNTTWKIVNDNG